MRLGRKTVGSARARSPKYDRHGVTPGIVHLGTGAFHRAHQAVYLDELLAQDSSWGLVGASLRSRKIADELNQQDGLYTLRENGPDGARHRIIGSILRVFAADSDLESLLRQMTAPSIRIVSLTVTEKGYCHDPASGELDLTHPDIVADLENPTSPRSAPGVLVEALGRRRQAGFGPFTVLSCDNLPENGATTRHIVLSYAGHRDADLAAWIEQNVTFPSTMVDRIVPATTSDDIAGVAAAVGVEDACPVITEPFCQWVVEDAFCAGRPAFETVGVQMVADVRPYEEMKLRMLNGSHSALAYLGHPAGFETVADATASPAIVQYLHDMMTNEVMPALQMPQGTDLPAYRDALIDRFKNPALHHRTWQIAMDGSQKLPQRLLATIADNLESGFPIGRLALAVAAWMRYVSGFDEAGAPIDVRDPMAEKLRAIADQNRGVPAAATKAFLSFERIFDPALATDPRFESSVCNAAVSLHDQGTLDVLASINAD